MLLDYRKKIIQSQHKTVRRRYYMRYFLQKRTALPLSLLDN